ncbi:uncharacterized protein [Rutidosis leptorrhynchoides]|uniref:uncharacterized protein n=1 Tax=Rutidosis leptorrhynchoides TaxID=125765 RepID=UPI003A9950D1
MQEQRVELEFHPHHQQQQDDENEEMPLPIKSTYGHNNHTDPLSLHHHHHHHKPPRVDHVSTTISPPPPPPPSSSMEDNKRMMMIKVVKNKECLRNHAASIGGKATDKCDHRDAYVLGPNCDPVIARSSRKEIIASKRSHQLNRAINNLPSSKSVVTDENYKQQSCNKRPYYATLSASESFTKKNSHPYCHVVPPILYFPAHYIYISHTHLYQNSVSSTGVYSSHMSFPWCYYPAPITPPALGWVNNLAKEARRSRMSKLDERKRAKINPISSTPSLIPTLRASTSSNSLTNLDPPTVSWNPQSHLFKEARKRRSAYLHNRRSNSKRHMSIVTQPVPFNIDETTQSNIQRQEIHGISSEYVDEGDANYTCAACGAMLWYQETLRGKTTKGLPGSFSLCCLKGKIVLPLFNRPPPKLLLDLYTNNHPMSKHFIENIRQYNMIFSFTSMGGNIHTKLNKGRGPYTFRIRGQNCHKYGGLVPIHGSTPKFSQLYIYDTSNEVQNRKKSIGSSHRIRGRTTNNLLDVGLIAQIMDLLNECNPLVKLFRIARDRFEGNPTSKFKIRLIARRTQDGRIYNLPTVDEIGALIVGDIDMSFDKRDILIESHDRKLHRISELHEQYLALQYPLIFAYAEDGYRPDIYHRDADEGTSRKKKRVTMREFFAYKIQERDHPSLLHSARKLYQQFLVDAYTMVESERISYIRNNQNILRCDSLRNLTNASNLGNNDISLLGNRMKLPSSFTGSARYMFEKYRDAMALCRTFGYPDLFLTFTCNPKWPEIRRILKDTNLKPEDKPTYLARMYKIKLDRLMNDIKKNKIFGKIQAQVYRIEFQKHGLPHSHICLFLDEKDKMPEVEAVDSYICAEIPDKNSDPELYQLVGDLMIHGPCGEKNPKCPCTDLEKRCAKYFPKPFSENTCVDKEGYPIYRRRDDGRTVNKLGHDLDNRNVVPYNPLLLKKYQAHLNVEWCNQVSSIRYLFKLVNKGNDRVTAGVCDEETDEIKEYYDCRYVSSCEAVWRMLSFDIHHSIPAVVRLLFHLHGEQSVVFDEEELLDNVLNKPSVNTSMFLEWMKCNKVNEEARQLTYVEFPSKFVWQKKERVWTRRKRSGGAIGRIHHVSPSAGELFYLRILLNKVRGPTSYEDIRTVNHKVCLTFKDASYEMGLLDDDQEYIDGIKEASTWGSGPFLRRLFAQLLLSNSLSRPEVVYEKTFELLSTDLYHQERRINRTPGVDISPDDVQNITLNKIEKILQRNSSTLKKYSMPYPSTAFSNQSRNLLIVDELSYDKSVLAAEHADLKCKLTNEQRHAYDTILNAVNEDRGGVFFLYGYGGTGKTFVWKTLSAALRSKGEIVLNVASSGIAALLLSGGRTAHSRFAIPINPTEESFCCISPNSHLAELIQKAKLIIWDEATMVHRHCIETLDRSLRDICRHINSNSMDTSFGGKVVVFGGDFRQVLPVTPQGKREDTVGASLNSSYIWSHVTVLKLTVNMRLGRGTSDSATHDTKSFANWVLNIGNGTLGESENGESDVHMPDDILIRDVEDPIGSLIAAIYPDFIENLGNPDYYQDRAILAPTHDDVNVINDRMMNFLDGEEQVFLSSDSICQSEKDAGFNNELYTSDFLNSIQVSGLPKHRLILKVGVPVMVLRNVDQSSGLCNGTRLQITELGDKMIQAKILTGTHVGTITCVPRMLIVPSDKRIPFRFQRRQYPLSVCFAMTINKSQGQSLSHVGLFLQRPVFTHGQLYVALSRVRSKSGLKVLIVNNDKKTENLTKNVVYKEVLQYL